MLSRLLPAVLLSSATPAFAEEAAPLQLFNSLAPCVEIDRLQVLPGQPPQLSARLTRRRHSGECGCLSALMAYQLTGAGQQVLAHARFLPPADGALSLALPATLDPAGVVQARFSCAGPE